MDIQEEVSQGHRTDGARGRSSKRDEEESYSHEAISRRQNMYREDESRASHDPRSSSPDAPITTTGNKDDEGKPQEAQTLDKGKGKEKEQPERGKSKKIHTLAYQLNSNKLGEKNF